jgi:pilus assembly protein CpaB
MFSKRTLMVLGVALFMALIAVWLAKRWVEKSLPATTVKTVKVVVANDEIPFASRISESQLKIMEWPKSNLPASYLSDPKEIVNKISTRVISSGEVINKVQIREHLGGSPLSALIEQNMRAMTVRVNDVVGVSGFILPGNSVDVLATPKPKAHYALDPTRSRENQNHQKTYVAVQNVKVLAVDQDAWFDKDKPTVRKSVTLQVSPDQAEKLATATAEGTIQLMLRNPLDKSVKAEPPAPEEAAPPPPPAEPKQTAVPEPIATPAPVITAPTTEDKSLLIIKGTTKKTVSCNEQKCESSGSGQLQPPYRMPLSTSPRSAL